MPHATYEDALNAPEDEVGEILLSPRPAPRRPNASHLWGEADESRG